MLFRRMVISLYSEDSLKHLNQLCEQISAVFYVNFIMFDLRFLLQGLEVMVTVAQIVTLCSSELPQLICMIK
jgi:hypothetical protein